MIATASQFVCILVLSSFLLWASVQLIPGEVDQWAAGINRGPTSLVTTILGIAFVFLSGNIIWTSL
jgi:hypothetical protein